MTLVSTSNLTLKIDNPDFSGYKTAASDAVSAVKERAGKPGMFLNWIEKLPKTQIENIDKLYELAEKAKNGRFTDLAVLGIGGSRHTNEALTKLTGRDSNIHFYSSVDPESFNRFISSLNLNKTHFLVVSKSGGTLETTSAYENTKKVLQEFLNTKDVSDRFTAMTDISSEKSKLRKLAEAGEIKLSGLVHDDVGGRFSIFDDASIFTLAFLGVKKDDVLDMLKSSLAAQEKFMTPDISKNAALQQALFNVQSKLNGRQKHFIEYFGDAFAGAVLWEKQLKNESLKAQISTDANIGPGYLHYNAEADLDKNNKDSFYTFVYAKPQDKLTKAVLTGVIKAYSNMHPVSCIELKDLSFASIAEFIEFKHFETLYTGIILRMHQGNKTPEGVAFAEVLQPNVEIYKKEVKSAMAQE